MSFSEAQYAIDELTPVVTGTGWKLPQPTNAKVGNADKSAKIRWTDPEDVIVNEALAVQWAGTVIVRKEGSVPTSQNDGAIVLDSKVRNQYKDEPFVDTGLVNGKSYFYGVFPYSTLNNYTTTCVLEASPRAYIAYAMHIGEIDSAPGAMITYPAGYNNSDFQDTAYMAFGGSFHWGDWENAFFIPRSCMLKYDGTVDYYLNENDETLKEDGSASDVANNSYAGNAMMEWGKDGQIFYWKVVPDSDGRGETFVVATAKLDEDMDAWNFYNSKGTLSSHFYTPKYFGSSDGTRLRSISGRSNYVSNTAATELSLAKANNLTSDEIWNTEVYGDWQFINYLLLMMCKSTNTQAKYGYGRCASGNQSAIGQGTMNKRGMFWGDSSQTNGVKIFGMENWYGNIWRRIAGYINANGSIKTKLCYGRKDGSTVDNYNMDGTGYVAQGGIGGTSGGYISAMNHTKHGMTPKTVSGSDSTYYTDGAWFNNGQVDYAFVGGGWDYGLLVGALYSYLDDTASYSGTRFGAALSCKPLA